MKLKMIVLIAILTGSSMAAIANGVLARLVTVETTISRNR